MERRSSCSLTRWIEANRNKSSPNKLRNEERDEEWSTAVSGSPWRRYFDIHHFMVLRFTFLRRLLLLSVEETSPSSSSSSSVINSTLNFSKRTRQKTWNSWTCSTTVKTGRIDEYRGRFWNEHDAIGSLAIQNQSSFS